MSCGHVLSSATHLLWVYNASPSAALGVTTRLEVTRELRRLGWRVTLVLEGRGGRQVVEGVEVLCIPKPQTYFLGYCIFHLRVLRFLVRQWTTIDVVLFHQMSAPWLLPLRVGRGVTGRRRPLLVMDTRDLNPIDGGLKVRFRVMFYNLVHRLANRWADGQTAITKRMAELVRIPPHQLWGTWPSGVNLERFAQARVARKWPASKEPICLIYVGNLLSERNLLQLCRAVERANAEGMKFLFSVVGDGPERSILERFSSGQERGVSVLPPVPHSSIPEVLAQAHVGVTSLPRPEERKYEVSSPVKLFEYMGAGLPVLCTPNNCHTEVIGNGSYAFWAEGVSEEVLLGALRRVWESRPSLRELGEEASKEAESWTWQEAARKLKIAVERGCDKHHSED